MNLSYPSLLSAILGAAFNTLGWNQIAMRAINPNEQTYPIGLFL